LREGTYDYRKMKRSSLIYTGYAGCILAIVAVLVAAVSAFGSGWDWWSFRTGFSILRYACYLAFLAVGLSVAGAISSLLLRPAQAAYLGVTTNWLAGIVSICGILIGLFLVAVPWSHYRLAQLVPPIHDITTDTEHPPQFVSIIPLRKNAPNSYLYGGPHVAALQRAAYPDIAPATLPLKPDQAFDRALETARKMGWTIVDANAQDGRIEATDTTRWFRFKDDIIIRVRPSQDGSTTATPASIIDVRSVSRVGKSDLGTNARRIRNYLKALTAR
jgi:uncharacterized protein (DUF1499 family)